MPRVPTSSYSWLSVTVLATLTLFATGCGSSRRSSSSARIRFINASPDTLSVNVLIDGKTVTTALANGGTSTAYMTVASGARHIQVQDPNTLLFDIDTTPTISSGDTTYIIKDYSNGTGQLPAPLILTDTNTAPTTGNFSVRAINLSPTANGGADAYVVVSTTSTLTGVTPNFSALPYPPTTASYVPLAVGTGSWEVIFTQPGGKSQNQFYAPVAPITFTAGQIETVLLVEDAAGTKSVVQIVDVQ